MALTDSPSARPRSLSSRGFRIWVEEHGDDLHARGITGQYAGGWEPRLSRRSGWISLSSRRAYGRVVRHGDGSSEWTAHRSDDGAELMSERRPTCESGLTDALVDLLAAADGPSHRADPHP